ncbi:protein of unknown function [Limnospira indica PCC 8005]|uniref:Uncharacterized protein n=1 Tax=Limnospira indica PCC 8005 TaxID=376219 RepID=A0A9P1KIQ8_9CYAN|nr:protein of unknown function [Limnospira indica PCC 8005]
MSIMDRFTPDPLNDQFLHNLIFLNPPPLGNSQSPGIVHC